jgi:hypothetical protein
LLLIVKWRLVPDFSILKISPTASIIPVNIQLYSCLSICENTENICAWFKPALQLIHIILEG